MGKSGEQHCPILKLDEVLFADMKLYASAALSLYQIYCSCVLKLIKSRLSHVVPSTNLFTAKFYKRPTKKEKLGLSTTKAQSSIQKNVQRNAPISAQFQRSAAPRDVANGHVVPTLSQSAMDLEELAAAQPKSAIEQKAQKLLLEAEKRALNRQQLHDGAGMDEDGVAEHGVSGRKKATGASGMKAKAKKRTGDGDILGQSIDYVDLL